MPMIDLAQPFTLRNGTKLAVSPLMPNDDTEVATFTVTLQTNAASGSVVIVSWQHQVSNTVSTTASRVAAPPAGLRIDDVNQYVAVTTRATPTGYTDLMNAWRVGATTNARNNAFKSHLYSAGHLDASLAET